MAEQSPIRQRRRTSSARFVGICHDSSRLVLIFDHRLDNTRHPMPRDFQVLVDGRPVRIKTSLLTSPMVENSGCAAVSLKMAEVLPLHCELSVHYLPTFHGMLSLVDKRYLAPASIKARCDEQGCVLLPEGDGGVRLLLENGASAALTREPALDRVLRDIRRFADNGWRYEQPGWMRRHSRKQKA